MLIDVMNNAQLVKVRVGTTKMGQGLGCGTMTVVYEWGVVKSVSTGGGYSGETKPYDHDDWGWWRVR
eukprot:7998880-Pyramimonas_sp.AAC.1